jgi:hypothetical protein
MIMARIGIRSRSGERVRTRTFELRDGYGYTAELADEVLTIALTAASKPVVVDAAGEIYRIPRRRLAWVAVWDKVGGESRVEPDGGGVMMSSRAHARTRSRLGSGVSPVPSSSAAATERLLSWLTRCSRSP